MSRFIRRACSILAVIALSGATSAQLSLTTTFMANGGNAGNMFDLVATGSAVTINDFDVNVDSGTWIIEIYACNLGTIANSLQSPGDWTLVSTTTVASNGFGVPTLVGAAIAVPIALGQTQGFYVTVANGAAINYTNGSGIGNVFASDANLTFLEGTGNAYPFLFAFNPRIFNGTIYYSLPTGQAPQLGLATLDINNATQANGGGVTSGLPGPYHTSISTGSVMTFLTTGTPNKGIVLVGGNLSVGAIHYGVVGQLDIRNPFIFADGIGFTGFLPFLFQTNNAGVMTLQLTATPPPGFQLSFQVAVADCSANVVRLSNAVEVTFVP